MVSAGQLVGKKGRKSRNQRPQLPHVVPLSRFVLTILEEKHLTPLQFALSSSVGKSTLYNIIAATHEPNRLTMQRLAHDLSIASGRIITSQELDSLMYSVGLPDSLSARGEGIVATSDRTEEKNSTTASWNSLIPRDGNQDNLWRINDNPGSSSMSHSPHSDRHGLKVFAGVLKVARMQLGGEIQGVAIPRPCPNEAIAAIMADLTPIETITGEILDAAEQGLLEALPSELIPGVAALEYITDENGRPYSSAELMRIVLQQLVPINKQTGQPFTTADLESLGIRLNGCTLA